MPKTSRRSRTARRPGIGGQGLIGLSLLMLSASCVPAQLASLPGAAPAAPSLAFVALPAASAELPLPDPLPHQYVEPGSTAALNAAIPLSPAANPAARSFVVRGTSRWDQARSLQCLTEAVYYEAGSESEAGQRAVAQVVLNRLRHPAYPGTVCGVVYQGPMRAGGGCQFTFTCDGSLARAPGGPAWARARRIAAAALAGSVYAPVGLSTHYHTHQVLPPWAFRLAKTAVIGAHNFYRMPGSAGSPPAFRQAYAGREPAPVVRSVAVETGLPALLPVSTAPFFLPERRGQAESLSQARETFSEVQPANDRLPQSRVREEYRNSGAWRSDALR